ncbi:MAG TPA: CRTAC1 family protein [Deltaproteobacteria bacterium]|nr:CRTAC1 family protein [Deltaproteobacteria bacterium]
MIGLWLSTLAWSQDFIDASDRLLGARNGSKHVGGSGYGGVAIFDADGDASLDLYLTDGPGRDNVLLLNDGTGHFTDATASSGAAVGSGSRAALAADLDGDGATDLVLPGDLRAPLRVLHNDGAGRFTDVTTAAGITGAPRNVSAHAADLDGDGDLDVFVAAGTIPSEQFANTVWRNDGDGTFTEIGAGIGLGTHTGACAATFTHLDDDDAIDLLVANCGDADRDLPLEVFHNDGGGRFTDVREDARVWGLGHWMGLALGDFDGDLRMDFFATNSGVGRDQPHALYRNDGDGTFTDVGVAAGVADWEFGWGTVAADFDNDGWIDLYYTGRSQVGDLYASPGHLFRNAGDGTFEAPTQPLDLSGSWTSGVATGDLDHDGRMDLVIVRTAVEAADEDGSAVLLLNRTDNGHHWLSIELVGAGSDPSAVGARIIAVPGGGQPQLQERHAGSSYQSTNSPWPHFGLGDAVDAELCVRWPDGAHERFGSFGADQHVRLVQGQGTPDTCDTLETATGSVDASAPPPGAGGDEAPCGCALPTGAGAPWAGLVSLLLIQRRRAR